MSRKKIAVPALMAAVALHVHGQIPGKITTDSTERICLQEYCSGVWRSDRFSGTHRRDFTATELRTVVKQSAGGFDTGVQPNGVPGVPVDSVHDDLYIIGTIRVTGTGSGNWWFGPKISVNWNDEMVDWYENYIIDTASQSPAEFHDRFAKLKGTFYGEISTDGGVYRIYRVQHNHWFQYYAVRQHYRNGGITHLKPILNAWRANGMPNLKYNGVKLNIETFGENYRIFSFKNFYIPRSYVKAPPPGPPVLSFTTPDSGDTIASPAALRITVDAFDADGIAHVRLFANGAPVRREYVSPYEWDARDSVLRNPGKGTVTLTAAATDSSGAVAADSVVISIQDLAAGPDSIGIQTVIDDMTKPHMGTLSGVGNLDWANAPRTGYMNKPPADWSATTAWGQVYREEGKEIPQNTRIQIRSFVAYQLKKSDGKWHKLQDSDSIGIGGAFYVEDFSDNKSIDPDRRDEGANSVSVKLTYGYNYHFWPKSRVTIDPADIRAMFCAYEARLILEDAAKPDDRSEARFLAACGGDYWRSLSAQWKADWSNNGDFAIARHKFVTTEWQPFTVCTYEPIDEIGKNPPPVVRDAPAPTPVQRRAGIVRFPREIGAAVSYTLQGRCLGSADGQEVRSFRAILSGTGVIIRTGSAICP